MIRKHGALVGAVAVVAIGMCSGCASAGAGGTTRQSRGADRATTVAYLRAREELVHAWMVAVPAGRAPMEKYVADVRAECGGILRRAPAPAKFLGTVGHQTTQQAFQEELAIFRTKLLEEGLGSTQRLPQLAAERRFVAHVAMMRWSDPAVTALVRSYAGIEYQTLRSLSDDVCSRAREWVNSGYGRPPKTTPVRPAKSLIKKWDRASRALKCVFSPPSERTVLSAVRQYETPGRHPATRQIETMESRLLATESWARGAAEQSLSNALGLRIRFFRHPHRPALRDVTAPPPPPGCSGEK